jgi:hypothetical protein
MNRPSDLSSRRRALRAAPAIAVLAATAIFAACNSGSSILPSITLPSIAVPSVQASLSLTGSGLSGCVDAATFAILNQLEQQGADVPALLDQNKPALITGLQAFQPPDAATTTWRDQLVTALQSNDMTAAATKIQMLASGEVSLSTC